MLKFRILFAKKPNIKEINQHAIIGPQKLIREKP